MKNPWRWFEIFLCIFLLAGCSDVETLFNNNPQPGSLTISQIQGAGHISPYNGKSVTNITGVVTAVRVDGFYLQGLVEDKSPSTSEAILILAANPKLKIGDKVSVSGLVEEYYPGGSATGNLSITAIQMDRFDVISQNNPMPKPVIIGKEGRVPPVQVIEDDQLTVFEPEKDGLDFFETLESMLVQVNNAIVVGPTNNYKEITVLADNGEGASLRTSRGGIIVRETDYNPERILLDDLLMVLPDVNVGDKFETPLIGVLDYSFGNFKILVKQRTSFTSGGLKQESAQPAGEKEISISGFNVQNLDPRDGQKKFDDLAKAIVSSLRAPDILSLEEVQDNNGAIDGAMVDASETYQLLVRAIETAGGPKYSFVDIAPEANQDGGELGGNIRVGFLYRTDRGVIFTPISGGAATKAVDFIRTTNGIELSFNPGRIDPSNPAFIESRKPLIGQFEIRGQRVFVIGLHLNSKGGDTPLFGRYQPPVLTSEKQRMLQAEVINRFVGRMIIADPGVKIIVLGDLNDFQFSNPLKKITSSPLVNLFDKLPAEERYSYTYDGNSQALDHILISPGLEDALVMFDVIHINSEFASSRRLSDHDPTYAKFLLP